MKKNTKNIISRGILFILVTLVVIYFLPRPNEHKLSYKENIPWNNPKLFAPFDIPIQLDSVSKKAVKDSLRASFIPIYTRNEKVADSIAQQIPGDGLLRNSVIKLINQKYETGVVNPDVSDQIASGNLPVIRILKDNTLTRVSTAGFTTPRGLYMLVDSIFDDAFSRQIIQSYNLPQLLSPNIIYDESESKRVFDEEYSRITVPTGVIQKGERIIDEGDVVTPQLFTILNTYELMLDEQSPNSGKASWIQILGQLLFVCFLFGSLYFYLYTFCADLFGKFSKLLFIMIAIMVFYILAAIIIDFFSLGLYIIPFVILPIIMLVFFDARTALFCYVIEILLCAPFATFPLEFIFIEFCAGSAAIYSLKELSQRSQLLRTVIFVALAYLLSYLAIVLMTNGAIADISINVLLALAINAVLTLFAYILMFICEKLFGFTSVVTLVELSDINNPLLRKLSEECPGTFQHSMAVSNLASDAARRINANVQLVRAGSLYHDIGKLNNPEFFTENQHDINPHDSLDTVKSAEIVIKHVSDGLKLADKAKLPMVICNFISEHHGLGKTKYFYNTYRNNHPDEAIDPALFTYPGPNPRSKETSLLMMADSVEAASRSLSEYSSQSITSLVNRIIDSQIADGLHNDSPLSFHDINVIKDAFINRLHTIYHTRIAYPDAPTSKGNTDNQ